MYRLTFLEGNVSFFSLKKDSFNIDTLFLICGMPLLIKWSRVLKRNILWFQNDLLIFFFHVNSDFFLIIWKENWFPVVKTFLGLGTSWLYVAVHYSLHQFSLIIVISDCFICIIIFFHKRNGKTVVHSFYSIRLRILSFIRKKKSSEASCYFSAINWFRFLFFTTFNQNLPL